MNTVQNIITRQSLEHLSVYNEARIKFNVSCVITIHLIRPTNTSQKNSNLKLYTRTLILNVFLKLCILIHQIMMVFVIHKILYILKH